MIRVFLADEQPVVLSGLRAFLGGTEFQVVGEATSGLDLVQGIERDCPHLVLIDTNQPSFQGFTENLLTGSARNHRWQYKVIDFSGSLKAATKTDLLEAIRRFVARFRGDGKTATKNRSGALTTRETEILRLIVQGHCNKEIARSLGIALDTVKEHVQNILRKTSLSDRTQAALWAVREGIASL